MRDTAPAPTAPTVRTGAAGITGWVAVVPLVLAGLLAVPFASPAVRLDPRLVAPLAVAIGALVVLAVALQVLHRSSRLVIADGELRVRSWRLRPTAVRLADVVEARVTPAPCARGHADCCGHDALPTLHLVAADGTRVAVRTGGWWADEAAVLAALRLGLRGNAEVDLDRAWVLQPPALRDAA